MAREYAEIVDVTDEDGKPNGQLLWEQRHKIVGYEAGCHYYIRSMGNDYSISDDGYTVLSDEE